MTSTSSVTTPASTRWADPVVWRIFSSFRDLALIVDRKGKILDVAAGDGLPSHPGWQALVGRRWVDITTLDSRGKVEPLLREAASGHTSKSREMNLVVDGLGEVPFRFTAVALDKGKIIAFGLDMRAVADLQRRMVSMQQAMELEYERVRQSEAHYRVLFHVSAEGVLIASGDRHLVTEANPAAATLLDATPAALQGKPLQELFSPESHEALSSMLASAVAGRQQVEAELLLRGRAKGQGAEVQAAATAFRQSGATVLLLRLWPVGAAHATSARDARVLRVLEAMPDAFVVTGEDLSILAANASFCELVEQANERQVIGQPLERWLGRPGVDLNIIVANLREHGVIRSFSTVVRGSFGLERGATLAAVAALDAKIPSFGFAIRPMASHPLSEPGRTFGTRSAEQLQELVGRVSLKQIVQETADLIERLCIEVALDISNNNRAAAAQLLGLSRQSLYTKLRRHGFEEPPQPS